MLKLLISLIWFSGDWVGRLVRRMLGVQPNATCAILYYHSIPDAQRKSFAHQMDMAAKLTEPIRLDRVPRLEPGRRYSVITFDDGFQDILDNAIPELEKRGIPATIFVTVGFLGHLATWWPEGSPERQQRIAPAGEWQRLAADLFAMGSHTLSHPHLPSESEAEARHELSESRSRLEHLLRRKVSMFSFPYGEFNDDLVGWCRDAGYERVFTSLPRAAFENADNFVTGRVSVEPTDWDVEFRLKLLGAYRWLPAAISWKRFLLSKLSAACFRPELRLTAK